MKGLSRIFSCGVLIFFLAAAAKISPGADWRDLVRDGMGGSVLYDRGSVERQGIDLVNVKVRYRNVYRYSVKNYSYSVSWLKIDCGDKKVTSVRIEDFDLEGSLMSSVASPGDPWYPIFLDSLYGRLYERVCPGGYPLRSEK
ncbi:MAG: hypothetical protein GTN70_04240 [Deltaproteobacteria bacterium]|nr:hypothetical protein [Deltaproteobacteria bacterium]NIS76879.1 hypothetical protein [Deltaproteobacteria bacterium]